MTTQNFKIDELDRRHFLLATAASLLLTGRASIAAYPKDTALPGKLKAGDTIGLINAASAANSWSVERSLNNIAALGLKAKPGKHLLDQYGYLAGQDRDRAADINAMFADPQVKAIFAMRGGWGSARLLPYLDWKLIRANPKLLIGYSDITALHLAIAAKAGFPTIHGPNAANTWDGKPTESFRAMAMEGTGFDFSPLGANEKRPTNDYIEHAVITPGQARGKLIGGNLTVLSAMVGSEYMPDMTGAILFLEDIGEEEYRIDRMLTQLGQAGILRKLSGFIFGQCRRCRNTDADYRGFNLPTILQQHIAPVGIPAFYGAHAGHIARQYCLPMGGLIEMDAKSGVVKMREPIVS